MSGFSRRPIASRDAGWARSLARRLAASRVTPNRISQASVAFAALAGAALWSSAHVGDGVRALLLLVSAAGCQARLICNLLDGLVAIEGGRKAPDGPFWNEAPDRAADMLILVGLGMAASLPVLGWAAAAVAVLTAYLRELGRAEGMPADFSGPLAKPQRMAVATGAAVLAAVEPFVSGTGYVLPVTLWILILGTTLTAALRARRLIRWLGRDVGAGDPHGLPPETPHKQR